MNKSEIQKIILWCVIAISTFIGVLTILPCGWVYFNNLWDGNTFLLTL